MAGKTAEEKLRSEEHQAFEKRYTKALDEVKCHECRRFYPGIGCLSEWELFCGCCPVIATTMDRLRFLKDVIVGTFRCIFGGIVHGS